MRVRFWGTRGSSPVALTSAGMRRKVATALSMAIAKGVNSANKLRSFIQSVLDETIRFEQLTRGSRPLRATAAYDGMELDV